MPLDAPDDAAQRWVQPARKVVKRRRVVLASIGTLIFASLPLSAPLLFSALTSERPLDSLVARPGQSRVIRGTVTRTIRVTGTIVPERSAIARSNGGTIRSVAVEIGEVVKKGQPLVRLSAAGAAPISLVRAPIDGTVVALVAAPGDIVEPDRPIAIIESTTHQFLGHVDPVDAAAIQGASPVADLEISDGAKDVPCDAGVLMRSLTEVSSVASLDQDFAYEFRCRLPSTVRALPGTTSQARIRVSSTKNVLMVARTALYGAPPSAFVSRLLGGREERVAVQVGVMNEFFAEIRSGLNEGDVVLDSVSSSRPPTP